MTEINQEAFVSDLDALIAERDRLREERDRAIEERDDAREARDDFQISGLVKMQHELRAEKQRGALLEALKEIQDEPNCAAVARIAERAIANVEGKDG